MFTWKLSQLSFIGNKDVFSSIRIAWAAILFLTLCVCAQEKLMHMYELGFEQREIKYTDIDFVLPLKA